ncbi:L-lysine 2,3-aminomutase [Candidatus Methylacidithermus pantelleriae]|uniref:L-lysine 2,3-aminomutase n=1 Tax=Candidatus Methylacidithermus pantelleriae TaxID=2744239 RepID=A0A8J2BM88_9BACT|nr:L-lysine 2,3-aminomutase [Candidatus Methylacidithermus pantelleriae]
MTPADLQSAPFGRFGICPPTSALLRTATYWSRQARSMALTFLPPQEQAERLGARLSFDSLRKPFSLGYRRKRQQALNPERYREFSSAGKGPWSDVPDTVWNDWRWQLRNRLTTLESLSRFMELTPEEREGVSLAAKKRLALAITPYFFCLLDPKDPACPLRRQVIPTGRELFRAPYELVDPCGEDRSMVAPGLVHRYPDRVLFLVTSRCASYCRYCTRSRIVSGASGRELPPDYGPALEYLRSHPEVRDVLLSGGDPLLLADSKLEGLLAELRRIPHIEILRIGTRIPIFLPQRITPELCRLLRAFHPLWINIHVNHPAELTEEARQALERLADVGIPLGNQSVLLRGINDDEETLRVLVQKLLRCRVRPYYLYQCDLIEGTSHFRTPVRRGLELIASLRGHTTGFAVPQFVVEGPGGGGKIPLDPDYVESFENGQLRLRNYRGDAYLYPDVPPETDGPALTIRSNCD